jgi:hypothetical protein
MAQNVITITEEVKELIYDIQNKAFLTGQAREADGGKNYEAASNMQASDDAENSYQIRRSICTAFAGLKTLLGDFLAGDSTTSDNKIPETVQDDGKLVLAFNVPNNFNQSGVDSLAQNVHSYIVDTALSEWFSITNKEDADLYTAHSQIALDNVKRALYKRKRPTPPIYTT